jgi:hypothetical protein
MQFTTLTRSTFMLALVLGLGFASLAAADPQPAANWQSYRSMGGGFAIDLPGKPETVENSFGKQGQKIHGFTFSRDKSGSGKAGAMLAVASDLVGTRKKEEGDKNLDAVRDAALKTMGAKLLGETRESIGAYPARRIRYEGNGYFGTLRVVLTDNRMYQVNAMGPKGYAETPEARRFLDSFALTGN